MSHYIVTNEVIDVSWIENNGKRGIALLDASTGREIQSGCNRYTTRAIQHVRFNTL